MLDLMTINLEQSKSQNIALSTAYDEKLCRQRMTVHEVDNNDLSPMGEMLLDGYS